MDFSKLRTGAVDFAVFLTGHLMWLSITIYSLWALLGSDLTDAARHSSQLAVEWLEQPAVATLVETYALRPLIPALAVFLAIFLLHVHQQALRVIGQYTPPELIFDHVPALRELDGMQWLSIQHQLGGDRNYGEVHRTLVRRYDELFTKKWPDAWKFNASFEIFKALALLNLVLFVTAFLVDRSGGTNLVLAAVFAILAAAQAAVGAYHRFNYSRWTLHDVIQEIAEESPLKSSKAIPDFSSDEVQRSKREAEQMTVQYENRRRLGLGWRLPVIGSLSILRQTLRDSIQRRRFKQLIHQQRDAAKAAGDARKVS